LIAGYHKPKRASNQESGVRSQESGVRSQETGDRGREVTRG